MLRMFPAILLILLYAGTAWGGTFSLDFNDESAQFGYIHLLSQEAYGQSEAGVRLLYNEDKDIVLGTVEAGVNGSPGNIPGLKTGLQITANGSEKNSEKLFAIGFALVLDYAPPSLGGLGVSGRVGYAPKIFTFMDARDYFETSAGIRYAIMPNAALTLSYQNVLVDFKKYGDVRLDDSVRIGVRINF